MGISPKLFLDQLNALINGKLEGRKEAVHKLLFSVVKREVNSHHYRRPPIFSMKQAYKDLMTFQTINENLQTS